MRPLDPPDVKGTIEDWHGGVDLNLDRKMDSGRTLESELQDHIWATLDQELSNQKGLVENIRKWQKKYKGIRDAKKFPYEGTANVATPLMRSDVDAIFVRIFDALTNKRRFFLMKPKGKADDATRTYIQQLEQAFDHYLRNVMKFREKLRDPVMQGVKIGTGIVKLVYETKNKTSYRYAEIPELENPELTKFKDPQTGSYMIKETANVFKGPNIKAVPREDFIISSDAVSIVDAYIVGFCFNLRKSKLKTRAAKGIYRKSAVDKLQPEERTDETKSDRTEAHGIELKKTEYEKPYKLWELWFPYDVDDDGEEDDIVVVWNQESKQILKAFYNPVFYGYRPFFDLKGNSVEFTFDGEGVCEILDSIQDEIDALHNLRLDRLAQINLPVTLIRAGIGINDFKLTPGKTWIVDEDLEAAVRIITFPDVYFSLDREEDRLMSYGDRSVGITPNVLGTSTAERPVAKETFANLEEANKKFKAWTEGYRGGMIEIGYGVLEMFAQYQPEYSYTTPDGLTRTVRMPLGNIRDLLEIDLHVSSEQINMEIRREMNIAKYQILTDYLTKTAGMVEAFTNPGVPSDFKKYLLQANGIGITLLTEVIADFDETTPEILVPDMTKSVNVQKNLMMSSDMMPPPPPAAPAPGGPGPAGAPSGPPNPGPTAGPPRVQ